MKIGVKQTDKEEWLEIYDSEILFICEIIEALQKATPKEAITSYDFIEGYDLYCPSCKTKVYKYNGEYCPRCGQALIW